MSTYEEMLADEKVFGEADWDQSTVVGLGEALKKYGLQKQLGIAIAIFFKEQRIYQVGLPGTTSNNDEWIDRKYRTVDMTKHSSLALRIKVDELGLQEEEFGFKSGHLAICGGGYPLYSKGELVGMAIVSGLPHKEDHQVIVDVLAEYRKEMKW